MKKTLLAALIASSLVSPIASAQGWRFLPILSDKSMKFEPTVAFTLSQVDPDGAKTATAYGVDFNFNCGLIQDPQNRMRTHLNISQSDEAGLEVTAYELSPRYTVPVGNGLSLGAGPSLAIFSVQSATRDQNLFAVGVAAGLNYRSGSFYAGADVRYHDTSAKNGVQYDNLTLGAKVGLNF